LEDEGVIRCPLMGHVLYLQVKKGLTGPTCVFPSEQVGWNRNHTHEKEMIMVPAVQGRILRFPGSAMHAVPKPPHRWFFSREEERKLRDEESCEGDDDHDQEYLDEDDHDDDDYDDDDDYYDDDEEEEEEVERSVLLFNTWPDDEPGPRGVNGDIATGALPEGIELSQEDKDAFLKSQLAQILLEWQEDYGKNGESIRCNPISQWKTVDIHHLGIEGESSSSSSGQLHVSLMGMEKRRLHPNKYVPLCGPEQLMKEALEKESTVSAVRLQVFKDTN